MSGIFSNSKIKFRYLLACLSLLAMNACSSGISLTFTPPTEAESVFDYYHKVQSMTSEQYAVEQAQIEQELQSSDLASSKIKLAVLLGKTTDSLPENELRAINLLESVKSGTATASLSTDYQVFAGHWLEMLRQRQKARELSALQQQSLTTLQELQSAYSQLDERYLGLARLIASLERQNQLLANQNLLMQQQIEALTVIEQQLAEREQAQGQQ